jgi:hypothetical protein
VTLDDNRFRDCFLTAVLDAAFFLVAAFLVVGFFFADAARFAALALAML